MVSNIALLLYKGSLYQILGGKKDIGMFYLHLFFLPFDYQFYSRMTTLDESTFQTPVELFMSFHTIISNYFDMVSYLK